MPAFVLNKGWATFSFSPVFVAVALLEGEHSPRVNYTEQAEVHEGSGRWVAGMAVVDRKAGPAGTVLLDGAFDVSVYWAVVGLEISPLGGSLPAAAPCARPLHRTRFRRPRRPG